MEGIIDWLGLLVTYNYTKMHIERPFHIRLSCISEIQMNLRGCQNALATSNVACYFEVSTA